MGFVEKAESPWFLEAQPTSIEFCHKKQNLFWDYWDFSVWWINWHYSSYNFAQGVIDGVIDHDQMTTVTLQTTYDTTLSPVYPQVACPLEISSESGSYLDVVSH